MATRKTAENGAARLRAKDFITDHATGAADTALVVDLFPTAEFETATSKVGGETVSLRRVVLTGPWEVVANTQ